jgi:CDP-diacylglycerol---glycerol-3-phosphate 3-phosphatidyltransferase
MTIYDMKSQFQNCLRPLVIQLAQRKVTANQITILALLLSILTGTLLSVFNSFQAVWLLVPIVMFVRMALNAIDGMLAKEHNMKSKLGLILNEISDVISDIALYLPFLFLIPNQAWMIFIICILSILTELAGILATMIGSTRRYDGPMGKSDRAFVFGLIAFLAGFGINLQAILLWALPLMACLLILTTYNRLARGLKETQ